MTSSVLLFLQKSIYNRLCDGIFALLNHFRTVCAVNAHTYLNCYVSTYNIALSAAGIFSLFWIFGKISMNLKNLLIIQVFYFSKPDSAFIINTERAIDVCYMQRGKIHGKLQ